MGDTRADLLDSLTMSFCSPDLESIADCYRNAEEERVMELVGIQTPKLQNTNQMLLPLNSLGPKFLSLGHFQSIEHLNIP